MFQGSMVALITPMHSDGSVDKESLKELIEWHIRSKTDALVIAGTTGESATLHYDEQADLIAYAVKQANDRIPVIAGTGTNSTETTIKLTQNAEKAGAKGCLVVTPYYNRPTQDGLYKHYKAVTESTNLPIILYNVPPRTGCDLLPETVARLAELPHIIGIKEATGKLDRATEILNSCPKDFLIFSGNDYCGLELIQHGAKGVISVTANVAPVKMHEMCHAALNGDNELAKAIDKELQGLHHKLFVETNPIPTKWALHQMGLIGEGIRMPLTVLDPKFYSEVNAAMQQAGVTL
ncbi:MAG TPA: 4-hydroxy-tetrahydrodipicolinate synthase [Gammaproteobacteria bacterium]|nr:4-hydroxy-tetrahydrodipicolinate synthase [Gammaproteobacteria bacterium]